MNNQIKQSAQTIQNISQNISGYFIGKKKQITEMLTGFISGLHVLIEDIPGVGKTTLAKCLAASVGLSFARIQFTPDLLPGDILGMNIWDVQKNEFVFKKGAILNQFILADEINRASPRTQSSLLEAMQEETVTVDGRSFELPQPFFVIATQNPITFTGTFPLPEAELDRFGISFSLGYASNKEEIEILGMKKSINPFNTLKPVSSPEEIINIRKQVEEITISDQIKEFIIALANKIRGSHYVKLGISPRSMQHLVTAARTIALGQERDFVIPEDVIEMVVPVLAHRIILSTEAHMEKKSVADILADFLATTPIPTGRK
ncbi:MAG: MoxR family ATPase [Spirochaetales bacterium]|nr:MoxR family ATPase [Spirochaetales bacterium]